MKLFDKNISWPKDSGIKFKNTEKDLLPPHAMKDWKEV